MSTERFKRHTEHPDDLKLTAPELGCDVMLAQCGSIVHHCNATPVAVVTYPDGTWSALCGDHLGVAA